jgi:hypothetical protein
MKILLGALNATVGGEDLLKLTIGNESLQEMSNNNRVRVVKFCYIQNSHCQKYKVPRW